MKVQKDHMLSTGLEAIRRAFPERQIFFRSNGEVKFIRLGPKLQMALAAAGIAAGVWMMTASVALLSGDARVAAKERELDYVSGELDQLLSELSRLQDQAMAKAENLEARQRFLESLIEDGGETGAASGKASEGETEDRDEHSAAPAAETGSMFAAILGAKTAAADAVGAVGAFTGRTDWLLARMDALEDEQERSAEHLAARESYKLARSRQIIERLELDVNTVLAQVESAAGTGGPLLAIGDDDETSATFRELQEDVFTRRAIEQAIASMPSMAPSKNYYISSRYGPRRDPFRKTRSHHAGLDMAGWPGEPILAPTDGLVVKARRVPAYGLMVEIDHGNGFRTRYGHMRRLHVKAGERVSRGDQIGEMGTSGRSTSTHLHWEVWFAGRTVDPLPYIEASGDVFSYQNRLQGS